MRLSCPAKINLHLRVGKLRATDGFHPLLTWMTTVGLFDTLTVETSRLDDDAAATTDGHQGRVDVADVREGRDRTSSSDRESAGAARILLLSSDLPGLPVDGSNLVVRAAETFARAIADGGAGDVRRRDTTGPSSADTWADAKSSSTGLRQSSAAESVDVTGASPRAGTPGRSDGEVARVQPVAARLDKRIPLGAGLGGGSSDAARTLSALNRVWRADWPAARLSEVAGRLGSDIPFFLHGPSSICTGRGEVVRPVSRPRPQWVVLVLPDIHMPTAAVYRRFDELGLGFDAEIQNEPNWQQWAQLEAKDLLECLVNDLETPAFDIRPDLGTLRSGIELKLRRPVRMSGSGSSLFTLFDEDAHEAESAAAGISAEFGGVKALAVKMTPTLSEEV